MPSRFFVLEGHGLTTTTHARGLFTRRRCVTKSFLMSKHFRAFLQFEWKERENTISSRLQARTTSSEAVWTKPSKTSRAGESQENQKLRLRPCLYGEKLARGPMSELYRARLYGKNLSRVMIRCPSQGTEISACACSAWCDFVRLGEFTRLKPFTWEKLGSPPRVTLSPESSLQFLM